MAAFLSCRKTASWLRRLSALRIETMMIETRSLLKKLVSSLRIGGEIAGGRDGDADASLDRLCDRDGRGRLCPALTAALDVGGVEPDVGEPVAGLACLIGLGVHNLLDERLGHHPYGLGHVHHAVVEVRHQGASARDLVYLVHMRLLPFHES